MFGADSERRIAANEQSRIWERIKRDERSEAGVDRVLADVPVGLPGLSRAAKLGKRAATVGFDWPDAAGVRDKIREELAELDAALATRDGSSAGRDTVAAEVGDLLFTIANLCRHLDVDPEGCVRSANARFVKRFEHVEARVGERGGDWSAQRPEDLDRLWQDAKRATRAAE